MVSTVPASCRPSLLWRWLWLLLLVALPADAQLPIKVGMSGPMTSEAGARIASGMRLAFQEANDAGGMLGRNLTLVALEDGYNATRTLLNIQRLLDVENVLLLAGVVGSDAVGLASPLIAQRRVPYVGAYSGVADLHNPFQQEFVNVRASYADEIVAQVLFLVQYARVQRIACLYQNDSFGHTGHTSLMAALGNVGLQLVAAGAYSKTTTDVTGALEAIAGARQPAQAVVLVATSGVVVKFINLLMADNRTDPACIFTVMSTGWASSMPTQLNATVWGQVYFFFVVPLPGDPNWAIARKFASSYYAATNITPGPIAFEGYINGRLIVEVLGRLNTDSPTAAMFLDEVYNSRLFVLDDLLVGMYSTNYTGCQQALCSCNSGMRTISMNRLAATGSLSGLKDYRFSVVECSSPVAGVVAPLLFGQLLPRWDAGWHGVALEVGRGVTQAFAEANAAGGAGGRDFVLVQQDYSDDTTKAMAKLVQRYPLVALLGSVVPSTAAVHSPIASVGNLDIEADGEDDPFVREEVHFQPATRLELMALAHWAVQRGCPIHLRAPAASTDGSALLDDMIRSVNTFQQSPATATLYVAAADVLAGAHSGCVIALGSDADVAAWYAALPAYPALHLLTLSGAAMRLMAVAPNASSLPQAPRLHFPTLATGQWNTTLPDLEPSEAWKYGYVLGKAAVQALIHSQYANKPYTTPAQLLDAWYTVKVVSSGSQTFGPFNGDHCDGGATECECNEGIRSVGVRSAATSDVDAVYSIVTCHVVYLPLQVPDASSVLVTWLPVGAVVGTFLCAGAGLYFRLTKRNNSAAPKDSSKAFCVLFTDLQASTHLWATIPDVMAPALDVHHSLIRKLIAKHQCYEVKTIGDSFMCVAQTPQRAVQFALAVQREFFDQEWADVEAINALYREGELECDVGRVSRACWNGLRVRVGLHYGYGDIRLDPVSKGYDYYGTVVNTAARIESACHGGQVGVSEAVYRAVEGHLRDEVWADLGGQPLRGLSEPIHMYQVLPSGPLASRTFPPLRIDHEDFKQKAMDDGLDELEVVTDGPSSRSNSVHPHSNTAGTLEVENLRWVETHPLVLRGDVSVSDLKRHYAIALATLSTLLTTQQAKFKQTVVHGLCERLHVGHHGAEGPQLQRTLRGLVHRVLPAIVNNVRHTLGTRQNSATTFGGSDGTYAGSFKRSAKYAAGLEESNALHG